jgi:hypothetical protein
MAGTSYTRQSTLTDGDTITASLFNAEYNQLVTAFSYAASGTTGHQHDGGAGEGGNIEIIGDQDFLNKIVVDSTNNRWGFFVEVSSSAVEQVRIQDGAIVPVTDSDIDLGTTSLRFKDTYTDTITTTGNVAVGGNLTVTGTATIAGNLTFGDAASDTVAFSADVASNLLPSADNTYDLGASGSEWKDLYIDGTANIDSLVADTADINGGTIDGAVIGGSSAAAGSFTTVGATGNITVGGTVDGRDVATDGTKLDGIEASADVTDTANVTAAGALMDSELTAIASVKALNQGVATGDSPTFVDVTATSLDISGNIDVDGTTNLDAVDIDGATHISGAITSTDTIRQTNNANSSSHNILVTTTNKDNTLMAYGVDRNGTVTGIQLDGKIIAPELDISGNIDVDGVTNLDVVDIDGAVDMASTLTVTGEVTANGGLGVTGTVTANDVNITDTTPNLKFTDTDGNHLANITQSGSHLYVDNDSTGNIRFRVDSNSERLTVNGTGIAVVGEITATSLDISGDIDVDGTANLDGFTSVGNGTITGDLVIQETGFPRITLQDLDGTNTRSFIDHTGSDLIFTAQNNTANGRIIFNRYDNSSTVTSGYFDAAGKLFINGDLDVDGTTNLDVVDIDGAVDMASTLAVSGNLTMGTSGLIRTSDGTEAIPGLRIGIDNDNGIYRPASNTIGFSTGGTERMRVDSTGIDVTGFVYTDGIIHTGDTDTYIKFIDNRIYGNVGNIRVLDFETSSSKISSADSVFLQTGTTALTRLKVNQNGDILFYEDTGTTAKLTWSATGEDLNFANNVKATFGANDDLQIYHDGGNSYIKDTGTGDLRIWADSPNIATAAGNKIFYGNNGSAELYTAGGAKRLSATGTGIDVTGSVVADGLTVDGSGFNPTINSPSFPSLFTGSYGGGLHFQDTNYAGMYVQSSGELLKFYVGKSTSETAQDNVKLQLNSTGIDVTGTATMDGLTVSNTGTPQFLIQDLDGTNQRTFFKQSDGASSITAQDGTSHGRTLIQSYNGTDTVNRLKVSANGGISFYEDTGTTTKFFWDAAEEYLGIGTSSPDTLLEIASSAPKLYITNTNYTINNNDEYGSLDFVTEDGSFTKKPVARIQAVNSGGAGSYSDLAFHTSYGTNAGNTIERMRLDTDGQLGIGTDTIYADLQVHASSGATLWITADGSNPSDAGSLRFAEQKDGFNYFEFKHDGSANNLSLTSTNGDIMTFDRGTQDVSIPNGDLIVGPNGEGKIRIVNTNNMVIESTTADHAGLQFGTHSIFPHEAGVGADGTIDLGLSNLRFKDVYLGGGVYLGGTDAANKLDDYEEGTWTPTLVGSTSGTATLTVSTSSYTKIGNTVRVDCYLSAADVTGLSGAVRLSGLPFAASGYSPVTITYCNLFNFDESTTSVSGFTESGNSYVNLVSGSSNVAIQHTSATSTSGTVMFTATYKTNS